jgi:P-type E1-E2 ATPase
MHIEIPGYMTYELKYLLLDYNGTIALDGKMNDSVKKLIREIAKELDVFVLTADTHGTAASECAGLPLTLKTFPTDSAMNSKLEILQSLDKNSCCTIGNGRNDILMCKNAALSICIMGEEGCCSKLIEHTHVTVKSIEHALELLLKPKRLIATLRG